MLFPVGTDVMIRPESEHYGTSGLNPKGVVGVIIRNDRISSPPSAGYVYVVNWPDAPMTNNYRHKDLIEVCPFEGNV